MTVKTLTRSSESQSDPGPNPNPDFDSKEDVAGLGIAFDPEHASAYSQRLSDGLAVEVSHKQEPFRPATLSEKEAAGGTGALYLSNYPGAGLTANHNDTHDWLGLSTATSVAEIALRETYSEGDSLYLKDETRYGSYTYQLGDYSEKTAIDTLGGRYIAPDNGNDTLGVWVRDEKTIRVRHFGAMTEFAGNAYVPIRTAMAVAGTGGEFTIDKGGYHLSLPLELTVPDQTIHAEGAQFDNTVAVVNRGIRIKGTIKPVVGAHANGGAWHGVIAKFSQGGELDISADDYPGVVFVAGGTDSNNAVAESRSIRVHCDGVGLGVCESVGSGGLLSYVQLRNLNTISPGEITNAGSGYKDGRFITRLRSIDGVGEGGIAGIRVSSGSVTECVVLHGGKNYETGDRLELGLPSESRAHAWADQSLFVRESMSDAFDVRMGEYSSAVRAANDNPEDPTVVTARANLDAEYDVEIGSGFVFTVGDVQTNANSWCNSNRGVDYAVLTASFGGVISLQANYNVYGIYAESIESGRYPPVQMGGVDNVFTTINSLINATFQTTMPETPVCDLSEQTRVVVGGGRMGSPYVSRLHDPDWQNTMLKRGINPKFIGASLFCKNDNSQDKVWMGEMDADDAIESFTPQIDFATNGDLSVEYTTQVGEYKREGSRVRVWGRVEGVVTYTSSSGDLLIQNFPEAVDKYGTDGQSIQLGDIDGINMTGSGRAIVGSISGPTMTIYEGQRDNTSPEDGGSDRRSIRATEVPSGSKVFIDFSAEYSIDRSFIN